MSEEKEVAKPGFSRREFVRNTAVTAAGFIILPVMF